MPGTVTPTKETTGSPRLADRPRSKARRCEHPGTCHRAGCGRKAASCPGDGRVLPYAVQVLVRSRCRNRRNLYEVATAPLAEYSARRRARITRATVGFRQHAAPQGNEQVLRRTVRAFLATGRRGATSAKVLRFGEIVPETIPIPRYARPGLSAWFASQFASHHCRATAGCAKLRPL